MYRRNNKRNWISENFIELILLFLFVFGLLLVINPIDIRDTFFSWLITALLWLGQVAKLIESFFLSISRARLVGGVLLIGAIIILYWRLLYRLKKSRLLFKDKCPRCGNIHLKRIHRKLLDRLISRISNLHLYRYYCSNCKWSGLRRMPHASSFSAHPEDQFDTDPDEA